MLAPADLLIRNHSITGRFIQMTPERSPASPLYAWRTALFGALVVASSSANASAIAELGARYGAYYACTGHYVHGQTSRDTRRQELSPKRNYGLALVSTEVDDQQQAASGSAFRTAARAVYQPGFGCVLEPSEALDERKARMGTSLHRATTDGPDALAQVLGLDAAVAVDGASSNGIFEDAWRRSAGGDRRTRAMLVVHRGKLLFERYGGGYGAENRIGGQSMSKSVFSLLVGAICHSDGESVDKLCVDRGASPREFASLLKMHTGEQLSNRATERMLFVEKDAARFARENRDKVRGGRLFAYDNGSTNILSARVRELLSDDEAYWRMPSEQLFWKIGIESSEFATDPSGTFLASGMLYMKARDWAAIGALVMKGGLKNDGTRVLSSDWIRLMGTKAEEGSGYGLHVWTGFVRMGGQSIPYMEFQGFGGSRMTIVPSTGSVFLRLAYDFDNSWDQMDDLVLPVLMQDPAGSLSSSRGL